MKAHVLKSETQTGPKLVKAIYMDCHSDAG
jgi:hypothetical protein